MAPTQAILRFPQTRKKSAFVLVQAASTGRQLLDLKLVGTDGFSPFVTTLRQDRVSSLQHSCPDDEWEEILISLFSQNTPDGVQATAKVEEGQGADDPPSHLTIEVRRSVQGITKHLGDITLRYKEEEPIDVVEWCSTSVLAHEASRASLTRESNRVAKLEKEVEDLQTQLNEFIDAKKADEAGLMEKFRDLLNEKKVKIREQQRLLAAAPQTRSPQAEEEVAATEGRSPDVKIEEEARGHAPKASRRSKRKTITPVEESEGDFEAMEVDEKEAPARDSEDDRTTEESDGDVTASEDEDEEPPASRAATQSGKGKEKNDQEEEVPATRVAVRSPKGKKDKKKEAEAPPPKRELPFAGRSTRSKPAPKPAPKEESETESDDEL